MDGIQLSIMEPDRGMRRAQSMGISQPFGGYGTSRGKPYVGTLLEYGNGLSWYAALARSEPVVDLHTIPYGGPSRD
jgi:hypothetical protein